MKALLGSIVSFAVQFFFKLFTSDAIEEEVNETSGNAKPLGANEYNGLYGLRNRSEGEAGDVVRESDPDS